MGSPITWHNINAPSNAGMGREFSAANDAITAGFDRFMKVISDREAADQKLADRTRNAAEQDYLNYVQSFKTPEEIAAARLSGVFDQRLAALDPRNQASARAAAENRLKSLQTLTTEGNTFNINQIQQPMLEADARAKVENAPITREIARGKLLAEQLAAPDNNALIPLKAKNELVTAQQVATLATIKNANEVTQERNRTTDLAVQGTTSTNTRQDQLVDQAVAKASQKYLDDQIAARTQLGTLAKKLGLPVDSSGAPDYGNMTSDQRFALDTFSVKAGGKKLTDVFSGDTKAAEAFAAELRKTPGITPEAVARNMSKITGAFNSVTNGAPVGNDALAQATNRAQQEVLIKEKDARNRYAPGSPDALNAYEELAKEVDGMFGPDEREDLPHVQKKLQEWSTKGIEIAPGKFIVPSKQDVLAAVRSTYEGWNFFNSGRAKDITKEIEKSLKGSDVTQLLSDTEESKRFNRQQAVRALLNPLTPAQQPLNPMQLPQPDPKKR